MPARSRSQQRLFAMVHAYNKGELHCGRSLRKRVVDLAGRISDDDARDFARTKHDGLPERKEEKKALFVRDMTAQMARPVERLCQEAETICRDAATMTRKEMAQRQAVIMQDSETITQLLDKLIKETAL